MHGMMAGFVAYWMAAWPSDEQYGLLLSFVANYLGMLPTGRDMAYLQGTWTLAWFVAYGWTPDLLTLRLSGRVLDL